MDNTVIPISEEFINEFDLELDPDGDSFYTAKEVATLCVEFAKIKVQEALEAAAQIGNEWENSGELGPEILNAYPLNLIK
jgi:hypothetical protein